MGLIGKRIVVFYHTDLSGKLAPMCGSDSILIPDQRLGIGRVMAKAEEHAGRMIRKPEAYRVEVWHGLSDGMESAVTSFIKLG